MKVSNNLSVIARSVATKQSKSRLLRALRALAMTIFLAIIVLINPLGVYCAQENRTVQESADDKISLDLKNVDIVELLRIISLKTGKTIVPSKEVTGRITVYLSNVAFNDVLDIILLTQGLALNPKNQLLFEGIDFRSYQLAFTFTPYSAEEAETVRQIIKTFKKHAAPTIITEAAGMFFRPPSTVGVQFMFNGKENPNIAKVTESVIESIDVNYAPNGWAAHDNGAPVQTTLTLQLKEIQLVDSVMIDKQGF